MKIVSFLQTWTGQDGQTDILISWAPVGAKS